MLAADIMTTAVDTTRPDDRAEDALRALGERSITALPVLDDGGRLVGIVSEGDLLASGVARDPRATLRRDQAQGSPDSTAGPADVRVCDVMTRPVVTAAPNQDVASLVGTMLARGIHSVPVVLGTRVVGMLSRSDVVRALARTDAQIAADVTAQLRGAGLHECECIVREGTVRLTAGSSEDRRLAVSLARVVPGVRAVVAVDPTAGG